MSIHITYFQLYSILGSAFKDNSASAFAIFKFMQGCIKFLIYEVCWGGISSCVEGRGISWLCSGEEYNVKKVNGEQYHLPYDIKAIGKNISWGIGEEDGHFGEENRDLK